MNLENIKMIVNAGLLNWDKLLLLEIAKDPQAIPMLLTLLDNERKENSELITDINFQLSRAHLALEQPEVNKGDFVQKEIRKFYKEGRINHCFKMD
jgi:hypothetical protein